MNKFNKICIIANKSLQIISFHLDLRSVIEGHVSADGIKPNRGGQFNLVIAELQPGIDLGGLLQRAAHQSDVATDARHMPGDGIGTEQRGGAAVGGGHFQDGSLAGGRRGLDLGGVVFGHLDVDAGVFGGDEGFEGTVIARDSVELVRWHGWCFGRSMVQIMFTARLCWLWFDFCDGALLVGRWYNVQAIEVVDG